MTDDMALPGHAGLHMSEDEKARRRAQGLPVYQPTDPKLIDQLPYIQFVERRGANSA